MKLGRRPFRASPYSVNWLTTMQAARCPAGERFIFPASSSKMRRLASLSAIHGHVASPRRPCPRRAAPAAPGRSRSTASPPPSRSPPAPAAPPLASSSSPLAGRERVPQRVAQQVEAQHGSGQARPGNSATCGATRRYCVPWSTSAPQDGVPGGAPRPRKLSDASARMAAGHGRRWPGPAAARRRWAAGAAARCARARAQRPRRLHVLALRAARDLRPRQPRVAGPAGEGERQHHVRQRGAEHRGDEDRQQEAGEGQQHVHRRASAARPRAPPGQPGHHPHRHARRAPRATTAHRPPPARRARRRGSA